MNSFRAETALTLVKTSAAARKHFIMATVKIWTL